MKKYIAVILTVLYLAYVMLTSDYEKAYTPLSYILRSIPPMPDKMIKGFAVLGILVVVSISLYIYNMKAGESDEQ